MLTVLDSSSIRLAQEAERRRIARELHDSVVQSLIALVADLEYFQMRQLSSLDQSGQLVAEKVAAWQERARSSLISMRQALGGLRQQDELDFGLEYAIQVVLSELREAGYTVVFECDNWPDQMPAEHTSHLYYIVREALTNISKHAHATSITVYMFAFEDHLHISIRDDGVGINKQSTNSYGYSGYQQGLTGIQERVTLLNGQLTIESLEGRGTRVDVDIPMVGLHGKPITAD
jgi:two-component system, NarL family, sensor histidine kinase DegS